MGRINVINVVLAEAGYPNWFAHPCDVPECECGQVIISSDFDSFGDIPQLVIWHAFYVGGYIDHCFICFMENVNRGVNSTSPTVICTHDKGRWVVWPA